MTSELKANALRRSKLIALDYEVQGASDGFVRFTPRTAELVLARTKGSGDGAVDRVLVPRDKVSKAVEAIERWIESAGVQPGEPILRRVTKGGVVGGRTVKGSTDETGGRLNPEAALRLIPIKSNRDGEQAPRLGLSCAENPDQAWDDQLSVGLLYERDLGPLAAYPGASGRVEHEGDIPLTQDHGNRLCFAV